MLERGVEAEVRAALAGPVSATARAIHGLADFAELGPAEAVEAYNTRVRRYAAYQRKWMRRIPGLVPVAANRPARDRAGDPRPAGRVSAQAGGPGRRGGRVPGAAGGLDRGLSHIYPPDRYPYPDDAIRARWREALADERAYVVVAERRGAVIGVAGAEGGWLHGLYVVPDAWGSGIAERLHDDALAALARAGAARARLWVLEDNERARRFYERRGWRRDGSERVVPFPPHPLDIGYTKPL